MKLYIGNDSVVGLIDDRIEDNKGAYDQKDLVGFIKLNALRPRTLGQRDLEGDRCSRAIADK